MNGVPSDRAMTDEETSWLYSGDKDQQAAIRSRDEMLMAAATGIRFPMVDHNEFDETNEGWHDHPPLEKGNFISVPLLLYNNQLRNK